MDLTVVDAALIAKLLLLLLIGMGPKIALVPFLEVTHKLDAKTKVATARSLPLSEVKQG